MNALLLLLGLGWAATAEDIQDLHTCLARQDVACAEAVVVRAGLATSAEPSLRAAAAEVAFAAGDYPRARDLLKSAVDAGYTEAAGRLELVQRTLHATAGWVETSRGRFRFRYQPGPDEVLVDAAGAVLERTDRFVTPVLGPVPPGRTLVEFFPTGRAFTAASSLTLDDVRATGVVALSKFTRLLVTTPRALGRGYPWQSTLSHEYIHLIVMHATDDRAPVWMQEGIARFLEDRWESGRNTFRLEPRLESMLAEALEARELVPFEEMRTSLAKIKVLAPDGSVDTEASSKRAQLAYAQLASLIAYSFEVGGEEVLLRALPLVRAGTSPDQALATAVGAGSFPALMQSWEAWVRDQGLVDRGVNLMPTVLDGGSEDESDPVLGKRRDLANFARLGKLLASRSHHEAALVEFTKARDPEDPTSPVLAAWEATSRLALGQVDAARKLLETALADYPDHVAGWRVLGEVWKKRGDTGKAIEAFEEAAALLPTDLAVHETLLTLAKASGDGARMRREETIVATLRTGGGTTALPPIHEEYGEYELPRDPEHAPKAKGKAGEVLLDKPGPAFTVDTLDGRAISLASLSGKVVILDFWATWCGPCIAVMPKLSALQAAHPDKLVVIGISDESTGTVKRWVAAQTSKGVTYQQQLALEDGSVRRAYGVTSIPQLVLLDAEGVVRKVHVGAQGFDDVEAAVQQLLSARPTNRVIR